MTPNDWKNVITFSLILILFFVAVFDDKKKRKLVKELESEIEGLNKGIKILEGANETLYLKGFNDGKKDGVKL